MPTYLQTNSKNTVTSYYVDYITIVSGLPRSGTSMMMRMLNASSLEIMTDNIRNADEFNPNGYYEFEKVKKLKEGQHQWLKQAKGKVIKIISALLEHLPNEHNYKIIFMQRDMDEILASQHRMINGNKSNGSQKDNVSDEVMAAAFNKHLQHIKSWLTKQKNMDVLYVSYNDIISEPYNSLVKVNAFLKDQSLNIERMVSTIDKKLYRHRNQ